MQNVSPIIGDRVEIKPGSDSTGTLMKILPRNNELRRPKVANVDQVVMVFSAAQPEFSFTMLDRYLFQAEFEQIDAAICINKTDLEEELPRKIVDMYTKAGYQAFAVCAKTEAGLEKLRKFLQIKTTVLAGPSGVGKSSIINRFAIEPTLATGDVSEKIGRGRHTTRHTEFVPILPSGYIIDTPGFSSLDPPDIPKTERGALFREFRPWLGQCKFRDCLHVSEKDCGIKEQIGVSIDPLRYERYLEWVVE